MSLRNWLCHPPVGVGLVVAAVILVGALNHHQQEAKDGDSSAPQHLSDTSQGSSQSTISVVGDQQAPPANPNPDRNEWRAERDLQAQTDMAKWTLLSLIATAGGLVVAVAGIYYVKHTLDATRDALEEARKATEVSRKALSMDAEPRVYIVSNEDDLTLTREGFQRGGRREAQVFFDIANAGRSAAIVTGLYRRWEFHPKAKGKVPNAIVPETEPRDGFYKRNYLPIGPGGHFPSVKSNIPRNFFDRYGDKCFADGPDKHLLWFYGYIEFKDLMDNEYVSGFALVLDEGRFHAAWPNKDPEQHNYQRRIDSPTKK